LFKDDSGRCLSQCPKGSFADTQTSTCEKCHETCQTCFGPHHDHCTTCPEGRWFYGDRCIRVCPDTHYADSDLQECLPCSANCYTCVDSPTNCKSCVNRQVLNSNFKCVSSVSCKESNDTACNSICHASCNTCSGPKADDCLSCPPERKLLAGQCSLGSCPSSYFEISYVGKLECKRCHSACRTCSGPSHTQCTDCADGFTIKNGICTPCPPGQYLNRAQEIPVCSSCYHDCSECSGPNEEDCTHCDAPLNLMGSRCVPCCTNASVITGRDCCHCMKGQGPCVTLEHTRSVYGAGEATLDAVSYPSTQWSRRILQMPSSVISFVAVAVVAVVVVFFLLLNLAMSNKSRLRLRTSWRLQGSSISSSFKSSLTRYRKLPDRDQDLCELLKDGEEDADDELLFQKT
jgi:proprotein convertase subtilisin/kexin type 5